MNIPMLCENEYPDVARLRNELLTCTMCGYCKMVCPVFLDLGWDTASPRGRMTMAYGLLTGELEPDQRLVDRIFQCTLCTDCMRRCPSSARNPDVILAARREMVKRGFVNDYQKNMVNNIMHTGNIFADLEIAFPEQDGEMDMFIGCQHLSRPNNTKKSLKLLDKLGLKPRIMKESCCGFPLEIMGFEKEHEEQKKRLESIFPMNDEPVLTMCPSCMVHLEREYGLKTVHIIQELNKRLTPEMVAKPLKKKVTYHDPCDLSRGAKITEEPRQLIEKLGGELVEMTYVKDKSRCCGGGGGILTWDTALSERMSIARIEEALETGAEMLITTCPTCEQTLKKGARIVAEKRNEKPIPVRHLLDLTAKAVGKK